MWIKPRRSRRSRARPAASTGAVANRHGGRWQRRPPGRADFASTPNRANSHPSAGKCRCSRYKRPASRRPHFGARRTRAGTLSSTVNIGLIVLEPPSRVYARRCFFAQKLCRAPFSYGSLENSWAAGFLRRKPALESIESLHSRGRRLPQALCYCSSFRLGELPCPAPRLPRARLLARRVAGRCMSRPLWWPRRAWAQFGGDSPGGRRLDRCRGLAAQLAGRRDQSTRAQRAEGCCSRWPATSAAVPHCAKFRSAAWKRRSPTSRKAGQPLGDEMNYLAGLQQHSIRLRLSRRARHRAGRTGRRLEGQPAGRDRRPDDRPPGDVAGRSAGGPAHAQTLPRDRHFSCSIDPTDRRMVRLRELVAATDRKAPTRRNIETAMRRSKKRSARK